MAKKTLIKPMLYTPLTAEANNFNNKYDNFVEGDSSKEELEDLVASQAKAMYMVAFNKLVVFKLELKDRIVAAQKITDLVLNSATPIAFKQNEYGKYGHNFALKNDECVRNAFAANGIAVDENAINEARRELGAFDKEKVEISIDDVDAGAKSKKVDAPTKSVVEKNLG